MNNQIRVSPVRVIDEAGKNLGEMETPQALAIAQERGLDLIEVGPNARPPVCRIADSGKWRYEQAKRTRLERRERPTVRSEVKGVRITFRASPHDLKMRATQADDFLREGNPVRVEMIMRGREKGKQDFARGRMREFLEMIEVPWKIQQDIRPAGRGLEILIVRDKSRPLPSQKPPATPKLETEKELANAVADDETPFSYVETENQ
ncbi:MAG: translation initiation factor IF-3 [Candidatus Terrybacteria bacterium]|nr:translation initiation factor IF-3 [Candidatus Terrybacteria bacterium]